MKFSEDFSSGTNIIHGYNHSGININGVVYSTSLVVSNHELVTDWPVPAIDELETQHLDIILQSEPEVIIIGTGKRLQFPAPELYRSVLERGMAIEFMDSGAACRTYTILLSENRRVTAGIIL
ncbi:MAG: hypothetical protein EP315_07825 [Gammaproteobacteria bacterium]|nr:MAG: hypothetical protein EP315_07825 [Gammaproteobacteria bacterium]